MNGKTVVDLQETIAKFLETPEWTAALVEFTNSDDNLNFREQFAEYSKLLRIFMLENGWTAETISTALSSRINNSV